MSRANIHDRSTIEQLYPRNVFEQDAARNAEAKAQILRGVRIMSPPDERGDFNLVPASKHVGEADPATDTTFVVPVLGRSYDALADSPAYGASEEKGDALAKIRDKPDEYTAFLDRVVETAKSAKFKPPIGRHEPRLRGFHGG